MKKFPVLIGNKLVCNFENALKVYSPINNKVIGIVPKLSSSKEINDVFNDAKQAFLSWKKMNFKFRKKLVLKFVDLLKMNKEELVNTLIWEIAKNKDDSLNEINRTIDYILETINTFEKMIKNPLILDEKDHGIKGKNGYFSLEPLGVVLAISPFNYPINLLIAKIIPALLVGNVVVYKPSTQGSLIGAKISELLYKSGFNKGQVSCIVGKGSEIGDFVTSNLNIDMISFTGSFNIGNKISQQRNRIPIVLEMGGKDAAIVLKDANLKSAAKEIIKGSFSYNGQRCTAIKRVLVEEEVEKDLIKHLEEELSKLTIGSAIHNTNITELISKKAIKYNLDLVYDSIEKGAKTNQKIIVKNNIMFPLILQNVSLDSKIAWEETFAPILPIIKIKNWEEGVVINNKSEYGLQASIFTNNIKLAKIIANKLDVGSININKSSSRGPDIFPFLGIKHSGFGVQGISQTLLSMTRIKGLILNNDKK